MSTDLPKGQRFSLIYLQTGTTISDSPRLRRRLLKFFDAVVQTDDEPSLGAFLERELGIEVLSSSGYSSYIFWNDVAGWELRDVLCSITLIGKFLVQRRRTRADSYRTEINRIFREEGANYVLDEELGVHPMVDATYQVSIASVLRAMGGSQYNAARAYVGRADEQLMPDNDSREAVRSAFAAVENVFKMTFPRATQLNRQLIQEHLRPWIEQAHIEVVARRVALKVCDALQDWADACHYYRHAEGEPDPERPPESVAVVLVSHGFSFLRWLVDTRASIANEVAE